MLSLPHLMSQGVDAHHSSSIPFHVAVCNSVIFVLRNPLILEPRLLSTQIILSHAASSVLVLTNSTCLYVVFIMPPLSVMIVPITSTLKANRSAHSLPCTPAWPISFHQLLFHYSFSLSINSFPFHQLSFSFINYPSLNLAYTFYFTSFPSFC